MKIYTTQQEVEKDIKDGVLAIDGDVRFECSISISASINAWDITALNITAWDINARNISYYAFCCVYQSIKCLSIKGRREKYQQPICLEGKIEYKTQEPSLVGKIVEVKIDDKSYRAKIID